VVLGDQSTKEAGLQIPVLTNRNGIRGYKRRVSNHNITKPLTNNPFIVDTTGIVKRIMLLPREISLTTGGLREVSRIHSSCGYEPGERK
jgi:hypothetical protein